MVDIHVSQAALLAEIQAQIAEASQVALLAELANQHGYVSQLAHINEVDPIMVRVAALCVLVELEPLEPTPRPVGRDDELTQSVVGESVTGVTEARTGGTAASGATSSGAATGQGAEGGASASGTSAQQATGKAAAQATSATQTSASGATGASESATSAASAGAATSATSASVGGATATGAGSPATSAASTAGGQSGAATSATSGTETQGAASGGATEASASDAATGATGGAETQGGTSATGAAGGQSATAASGTASASGTAASGATGASAQSAAPPSATGATGGTAASAASGGSTSGASAAASGGQPGQPGAGSAGGVAAGVAAAIAAAGAQAATVSQAAANAQNALFATLAASRGAVAQGTNLGSVGGTAGGSVSEVRTIVAAAYVDWDRNGIYTNESAYLISARGNASLTAPEQMLAGGRGQVASCQIVLDNKTRRFSPANSSGALYSYIAGGAAYMLPVLVDVTIDGTTYTLFTGYIRELTESAPTPTQTGRVTLECRAKDEKLLQDRLSTPLADFLADSAAAHTEDFHIVNLLEAAGMVDGTDFVSPAYALANPGTLPTIDGGIFPIRYVWLDGESVLDKIWQLTAACCGWFYCDHLGKFHYHNLTAVLPDALERQYGDISTLALDEEHVAGLQLKWPTAELYNEVAVEVSPRAPGEAGEIWAPDDPIVVQPDQTKVVWCRLDAAQVILPTLTFQGYTAGGIALNTNIVVERTNYAQRVRLHIWNNNVQAAYMNTLRLDGQTLSDQGKMSVEAISSEAFWTNRPTRRRSIRNNIYIQSEAQAETIAAYALKRQELPVLMATIPGVDNPDLRLAYPVSIEYSNVVPFANKITGIVSGLSWRLDNTGFRQDVTVLETASLFADYDPIFVLGTNKLGASGTDTAYLFY